MDRVPKIVFSFFSCEDIVNFCDIHSKFLFSNHSKDILKGKTCCESYFNMEPRFTYSGTCYTTRQLVLETVPSIFSSITLWLTGLRKSRLIGINKTKYVHNRYQKPIQLVIFFFFSFIDFDMFMFGSYAIERGGISYVLTKDDHPAAIMASDVRKIPMGTVNSIGLTRKQTDRSQIKFESCLQSNTSFEAKFGCPASQANCKLLRVIHGFKNCTMATFYGLPKQSK